MANEVGDRPHFQAMLGGKHLQLRTPRHRAVLVEDLNQHACWLQTSQQCQIRGRFGMPCPRQHAARLCGQREDVAGLMQVFGLSIRRHRGADRMCAIVGGNTGGDALGRLDRHREVGAKGGRVVRHHRRQAQLRTALAGHRQADQAAPVARHEVDVLGPHLARGHDQVTLVLAVLVIDDDHHLAGADVVEQFGNRGEAHSLSPTDLPLSNRST